MGLIDFILNLAGLLLWLNWCVGVPRPGAVTATVSLLSTLKQTEPPVANRHYFLAGLVGLLVARSFFYWHIGGATDWTPNLQLGAIVLPFRSDLQFGWMLLYSFASFGQVLLVFYFWLLLLSVANGNVKDTDPYQRMLRQQLGWMEVLPAWLKLVLPLLAGAMLWVALNPLLLRLGLLPAPKSPVHCWEQSVVIGMATLLAWKSLLIGFWLLHLLNSYVYLGNHLFWNFVNVTSLNLLLPLRWLPLRLGRVDFAPLLALALVFWVGEFAPCWLTELYRRLPL